MTNKVASSSNTNNKNNNNKCALCSKIIPLNKHERFDASKGEEIIIDGIPYRFDAKDCATMFKHFRSVYGSKFNELLGQEQSISEPETKNVEYLLDTYGTIKYYVDIHSFEEMILYSSGDDDNQSLDHDMNFQNSKFDRVCGKPRDLDYKEYIDSHDEKTLKTLANRMNYALESGEESIRFSKQLDFTLLLLPLTIMHSAVI